MTKNTLSLLLSMAAIGGCSLKVDLDGNVGDLPELPDLGDVDVPDVSVPNVQQPPYPSDVAGDAPVDMRDDGNADVVTTNHDCCLDTDAAGSCDTVVIGIDADGDGWCDGGEEPEGEDDADDPSCVADSDGDDFCDADAQGYCIAYLAPDADRDGWCDGYEPWRNDGQEEEPETPENDAPYAKKATVEVVTHTHGAGVVSAPQGYGVLVETFQVTLPEGIESGTVSRLGLDLTVTGPQGATRQNLERCTVYGWPDNDNCVATLQANELPLLGHTLFTFRNGCRIEQVQLIDLVCDIGTNMPVEAAVDAKATSFGADITSIFADDGSWIPTEAVEETGEGRTITVTAGVRFSQIALPTTVLTPGENTVARIAVTPFENTWISEIVVRLTAPESSRARLAEKALRLVGSPELNKVNAVRYNPPICANGYCSVDAYITNIGLLLGADVNFALDIVAIVDTVGSDDVLTAEVAAIYSTNAGSYGTDFTYNLYR